MNRLVVLLFCLSFLAHGQVWGPSFGGRNQQQGIDISAGRIPGSYSLYKFGKNPDIDVGSSPEDIWEEGGVYVPPTAARIHDIVSDDADDNSSGTGMRTVRVQGLNSIGEKISEDITLNGTTNVPTDSAYTFIYRMKGLSWGSSKENEGGITATAQTDGTVSASITAGSNQTLMAIYKVASNQTGYLTYWRFSMLRSQNSGGADCTLEISDSTATGILIKDTEAAKLNGTTHLEMPFYPFLRVAGGSIVKISCFVTDNNTDISAAFSMIEEDN